MAEQTQTKITAYGRPKSSREGGSTVINYTVNGGGYGSSNINARSATINRIKSELIDTNILNAGTGNFVYLVATDGTISTLRGTDLNYQSGYIDELQTSKIKAHELTMNEPSDIAKITTIFNEYLQGKEIVTDYLTVNKAAHFFEVVIDKIKSVGGTIINTACNSTIDYVQGLDANDELTDNPIKYRCYFKRTQDDGTHITNDWMVNDQAICQACNLVPGTSYDKGTHYYWRLVVGRNNEEAPVYVNFNTGEVDDESTTQPDYFVVFKYGEGTSAIFTYDKTIGNDGGTPVKKTVTAYTSTGDIATDMSVTSDGIQLKIEDTIHGLTVLPDEEIVGQSTDVDGTATNITQKPVMMGGGDATFSFETMSPTRLNVAFVFDDGTIEFHPIGSIIQENNANHIEDEDYTELNPDTDYLTEYSVGIISEKNINFISITSDEVNVWNSCHYIDLSNETGEYDIPQHIVDNPQESDFNMAPVAGDNIVQLGYRYGNDTTKRARASAIIIASYKTPDADIKPPSYAQYMDIIDFDLSSHRKTYFDATRFVINNADIEDVVLDTIRIIPEQNPITKDENGNFNTGSNGFDVSFLINSSGTSTLTPNVPANTYLTYTTTTIVNPVTVTAGNHPVVPLNANDTSINVTLYNTSNMVIDTLNVSIILMADISNGKNGEYDQWAYVNRIANPGYPNENNADNTSSAATYPPTGGSGSSTFNWNTKPTTPTGTQNSWMTTRHISFDSSNLPVYGPWSYPIRMNGENGRKGEDGTDFEFIYYKTNTASATNPNNIPKGEVSPTGVANGTETNKNQDDWVPNGWTDRPQGVESDYQYEYMSQRNSYNSNGTKMWNAFTTPALWSKWGENGQDGDGIKYIFTMASNPLDAPQFGTTGWNDAWSNRFDSNNNNHMWYDNSFSPTDTVIINQGGATWFNSDVLCSISKTYAKDSNGVIWWTNWSTPKTWAMYVTNGQPGATGAQGDPGDPGEGYILTPVKRTWEVALTEITGQKYENLASVVTADLEYKVSHWKGDDQIEEVDLVSGDGFSVKAIVKDASGNELKTYTLTKNLTYDKFTLTKSNVLQDIGGHGWSNYNYNYRRIITEGNTTAVNSLPVTLEVQLLDGQTVINNDIRTLITEGKGLFITTNSALQSVYQGVGATGPTQYSNYFTNLQQTMKGFELSAAEAIIGSNGAFTTFGSDHLPQTTTEKCFLTAYTSSSSWPGGGAISIYDSSTPSGVYNNNGTVCYDGSSYWNSSTSMPTLSASASYLWMVRGYRTYDSSNSTYTPWKTNTPVLWGVYDQSGTIYNNANLAITARSIKNSVSSITQNYATKAELELTADSITSTVESISNAKDNLLEDTTFDSVAATVTNGAWRQTTGSGTVNGLSDTTEQYQGSNCLIFDSRGSGSTSSLISIEQFVPVDIFDSGEPYTLSVYVKKLTNNGSNEFGLLGWTITNGNIIDYTNMSGSAGPSETNVTVNGTGPYYNYGAPRVSWFINDNEWHRLFITFKNIAAYSSGKAMIGIRNWKSGSIGNQYLVTMPKLEKGSTPSLWVPGTVDNKALKSEISQTATTVSITALNTIINGDLDLHGTFTSDDQENMNKCIIDSENGGIKIYGPSSINDSTGKPASGATYKQYMDLTWTQDENGHRYGLIALNTRNTNDNPGAIHAIQLDDTGFDMHTTEKILNFNCDTILYSDSSGNPTKSSSISWEDLIARLTSYRIIESSDYGTSLWRVNEVNDVYIFDNTVASINFNSSSPFEIGSGTAGNDGGGTTASRKENRHLYDGRTITIKPVNGLKIHNEDGYIITKGTAWSGGYGTPSTGSKTITFNGNNSTSTHDYFPMKLIRHDGHWIEI